MHFRRMRDKYFSSTRLIKEKLKLKKVKKEKNIKCQNRELFTIPMKKIKRCVP